jgi:hypothetical protein
MGSFATARRDPLVDAADARPGLAARVGALNPVVRQPNTWTGLLVLTLAVVVVWQHPISQHLGTAATSDTTAAVTAAAAAPAVTDVADAAETAGAAPPRPGQHDGPRIAVHAPRDPFRALVSPTGATLAPVTIHLRHPRRPSAGPKPPGNAGSTPAASPGRQCAAVHVVHSGESLWSIASDHLATLGYSSVTSTWHAVYAANHKAIGSSPGSLAVGTRLCLPSA